MNTLDFDLSLIDLQTAGEFVESAKSQPTPKALFGEFWREGELAILFADTGKGKSALAVQIAESIARGKPIAPFEMSAKAQKVLYMDFELTRKQFEMRYAKDAEEGEEKLKGHYKFSKKFYRAEIRRGRELPEGFKTFEQYIRAALEPAVRKCGARVLMIDNLTYLRGPSDSARESLPLMRELIRLKEELGLSILVIAHTPKRAVSRRLSVNDLQGSKVLANFADSIFAIGQSGIDVGIRYLKQLKARSGETVYDEAHVPAFEIKKLGGNFLGFTFRKFSEEVQHLKSAGDAVRRERAQEVAQLSKEGHSQRAIAAAIGISAASVNRYLHMAEPWSDDRYNDDFLLPDEEEEEKDEDEEEEEEEEFNRTNHPPAKAVPLLSQGGEPGDLRFSIADFRSEENPGEERQADREPPLLRKEGSLEDDGDENPMAGYGLTSEDDACTIPAVSGANNDEPRTWEELISRYNGQGTPPRAKPPVGTIEQDRNGQWRKRTIWGWDYCKEATGQES